MIRKITSLYHTLTKSWRDIQSSQSYTPSFRLVDISTDENENHIAKIQVISKNITFDCCPEEILAKDDMVDLFSPRDIRTLTYLGYLGVNSPKYKILAQRLSKNDQVVFALKKKGHEHTVIKTADEIMKDQDVLNTLGSKDAHLVGYTAASEQYKIEQQQKEALRRQSP
jgi:hypothetical protein